MGTPSHVNEYITGSAASATFQDFISAQAGDLVVVAAGHTSGNARDYSIADDKTNTGWVSVTQTVSSRTIRLFYRLLTSGDAGTMRVTVTQTGGAHVAYLYRGGHFRPAVGETFSLVSAEAYTNPSSSGTHYCSSAGITMPAGSCGFAFAVTTASTAANITPVAWTSLTGAGGNALTNCCHRMVTAVQRTSDRADMTIGGTLRTGPAAMVVYESVGGGGGGNSVPSKMNYYRRRRAA